MCLWQMGIRGHGVQLEKEQCKQCRPTVHTKTPILTQKNICGYNKLPIDCVNDACLKGYLDSLENRVYSLNYIL